ncbi:MAG: hypothetical protein IKE63_02740 [Bacilli bacterium]|nr:hypothetical protein [Bacilli bacterium]
MDKVLLFSVNAGFSVCSISICLCIMFSYFLKHREGKLETKNRLFISYLTSIVIMSIVEIIYVLYFLNVGENGPYAKSLYYLYSLSILLATTTSWMFTISYRTALKEEDPTQKKSNRKYLFYAIIGIIELTLGIMIFTMPVHIFPQYGVYTFKSLPITLTVLYTLISIAIFVAVLYFRNPNLTKRDLYPIITSLVVICALLIYRLITGIDINVETFQLTIYGLGIFFTLENQDYKLLDTTQQKRKAAESATKSQKEFLANMSHELRSPMNTILGLSQLLLEEEQLTKDGVKDDMTNIHTVSTSLLALINSITDYSSLISGKEKVIEKEYDPKEIFLDLNLDILNETKNNNISFDYSISDSIPRKLYGDSAKISKILYNIIHNAISYTRSGQITLSVNGNQKKNEDVFRFEFLVSTPGIDPRQGLFDNSSDEEIDESENKLTSETLNILIIRALASALEGKLDITKEKGVGTKYHLIIDQNMSKADTDEKSEEEEKKPTEESTEEKTGTSVEEGGVAHV